MNEMSETQSNALRKELKESFIHLHTEITHHVGQALEKAKLFDAESRERVKKKCWVK